ncbi:MAG: sigma-70 family RNA polymerase sigma factor [Clostridiales Family XIII bacterium]|jgi:RNA polymerase sporulation-specific sigma factor|nr:sigma-70 family RNA polymerase sigma factor [Clostridiales Family XIII bacterium]
MNYAQMPEERLVELAKGGDGEAYECLYASCRDMLRSKANLYFMVGADRDDVIQEGMIGLLKAIRSYDPQAGASFRTYAELVVKRQILNAVKMAGRKKHTPLNESLSIDVPVSDGGAGEDAIEEALAAGEGADPEQLVLLADLFAYVGSNAPQLFSKLERRVWDLFTEGRNPAQIAAALGKPPKSVENTLQRIKKKVEKLVALY